MKTHAIHVSAAIVGLLLVAGVPRARAGKASLTELGGAETAGVIEIHASPAQVYAVVTDYKRWPAVLTDVTDVSVSSGGRADAKVWFRSRAMRHAVTVLFDNTEAVIRFRLVSGPRGARAKGTYALEAIDGGKRTRIKAVLYMNVVGIVGWVVPDSTVRKMRQRKLRTDLEDLAAYFGS